MISTQITAKRCQHILNILFRVRIWIAQTCHRPFAMMKAIE